MKNAASDCQQGSDKARHQLTYLVGGLGRVLLNTRLIAGVHRKAQDVACVLESAATQQHLVHGHRHCLGLLLACTQVLDERQALTRRGIGADAVAISKFGFRFS